MSTPSVATRPPSASTMASAAPVGAPSEVRRVAVFVTVSLALFMVGVDQTIVATGLHALQHGLHTTVNWAGWTITAYSLGFMLMLPVSGKFSSRLGRRRVFLGSAILFSAASLACGFVDNAYALIVLRALQAAGGAGFTPSATGIVVDHFGDQRDRAVSLFGSIFPIGDMFGPVCGGLLVSYWSWRGVFFVNVPVGVLLVVLCLRYIPRDPPLREGDHGRLDALGMTLLGVAIVGGMLAVTHLGGRDASAGAAVFIVPLVLASVAGVLFVRHLRVAPDPFIKPRLIYGRGFGAVNLLNVIFGGVSLAVIALLPLYAANRYGMHALSAGTLLVAEGFAAVLASTLGAIALRRSGYRLPLYLGSAMIALGILLIAVRPLVLSPYAWLSLGAFVLGAGVGATDPPGRNAGLQLAPHASATLAALRTMFTQVGAITTISVATAIIARNADSGLTQAWIYAVCAALTLVSLPLIRRIPEHHGGW